MAARDRTRETTAYQGTAENNGIPIGGGYYVDSRERCRDVTGKGDNEYLVVDRFRSQGGQLNRQGKPGTSDDMYFNNYVADAVQLHGWTHLALSGELPTASYVAQAAARSNPSRPYVDVPVNILELGDIAQLIKDSGDTLLKKIASNNLRYQFGIAPLVSDLVKLTRFQDQVDRRIKEINRLHGLTGLRKTMTLDSLSASDKILKSIQTNFTIIRETYDVKTTKTIRAHTRWSPTSKISDRSSPEMRALAKRAVLGLTLDFATAWEAMPFSWLIDWCSNIGNLLKANRNIIPAKLDSVTLMRHTRTTYVGKGGDYRGTMVSPSTILIETKRRDREVLTPTAHFPFLSGNQMGILASLAITRT